MIIEVNLGCVFLHTWMKWDGERYVLGFTKIDERGQRTEGVTGYAYFT